VVMVIKCARLS